MSDSLKSRLETDAARFATLALLRRHTSELQNTISYDEDSAAVMSRIVFDEEKTPQIILDAEYALMAFVKARTVFHKEQLEILEGIENSILDSFGKYPEN